MMSVSKEEVSELIMKNRNTLMSSFKDILKEAVHDLNRTNKDALTVQIYEIKKLKYNEPCQFKKKANKDQFKSNLKLAETMDNGKTSAETSQLEKVKAELEEGEKLLGERQ